VSAPIELPLRIVDQPGGAVVRCLCGAELASMRRGLANELVRLRSSAGRVHLSPDVSPAGLLCMIVHAKSCAAGQERQRQILTVTRPN